MKIFLEMKKMPFVEFSSDSSETVSYDSINGK